jgi:GNAT superfamily N-acetyltransferase
MHKLYRADLFEDRQSIQELFTELLQWINENCLQDLGIGFDVQAKLTEWMSGLHEFSSPNGCLVLVIVDSEVAGIGCIKTIGDRLGEVKHMYMRPKYRGQGLGRSLLEYVIDQSLSMGHELIRLDTGWFMKAAQNLYHSSGFREISPYPESEVSPEIHHLWVFMEKPLEVSS